MLSQTCTRHVNRMLVPRCTRHVMTALVRPGHARFPTEDLTLEENFLSEEEQTILLRASLHKLDGMDSVTFKRRRKAFKTSWSKKLLTPQFCSDDCYPFEERHFDGVISRYREMHLSDWPSDNNFPGLSRVIKRMHSAAPSSDTQTHLLHLASDGYILPHVDNLSASGSWILGVSLGASRILRLEGYGDDPEPIDIMLPPGSLYIQRDSLRYSAKHSILPPGQYGDCTVNPGQRLSVMIRDRLPK